MSIAGIYSQEFLASSQILMLGFKVLLKFISISKLNLTVGGDFEHAVSSLLLPLRSFLLYLTKSF